MTVLENLGNSPDAARDDGQSERPRLEQHDAERFRAGRKAEDRGSLEEGTDPGVGNVFEEEHVAVEVRAPTRAPAAQPSPPLGARQAPARARGGPSNLGKRAHEHVEPLLSLERGDDEDERRVPIAAGDSPSRSTEPTK